MNERIKELAEQAEEWNADGDKCEVNLAKFAELIIRECAKLADNTPGEYLMQPYKYPSTFIKEHFGVEE